MRSPHASLSGQLSFVCPATIQPATTESSLQQQYSAEYSLSKQSIYLLDMVRRSSRFQARMDEDGPGGPESVIITELKTVAGIGGEIEEARTGGVTELGKRGEETVMAGTGADTGVSTGAETGVRDRRRVSGQMETLSSEEETQTSEEETRQNKSTGAVTETEEEEDRVTGVQTDAEDEDRVTGVQTETEEED